MACAMFLAVSRCAKSHCQGRCHPAVHQRQKACHQRFCFAALRHLHCSLKPQPPCYDRAQDLHYFQVERKARCAQRGSICVFVADTGPVVVFYVLYFILHILLLLLYNYNKIIINYYYYYFIIYYYYYYVIINNNLYHQILYLLFIVYT